VNGHPEFINSGREMLFGFTVDQLCCVPAGAPVQHMKDDVVVNEQQIGLNLLVESVRDLDVAGIARPGTGPLTAHLACLDDLWQHLQHSVWHSAPLKHSLHSVVRSMPPPHMQFPEREAYSALSIGAEEAHNAAYVEIDPVACVFWANCCIAGNTADSRSTIRSPAYPSFGFREIPSSLLGGRGWFTRIRKIPSPGAS